jgi:outer membrane protein OmpA-like peptidoglycan-associated protein
MSHPATTPLQILVEHCTAERDEGLRPSLSLKGNKAVYVAKLDELEQLLALELPGVPVAANSDHLFQLHDEQEQRSLGRDYHQPLRAKRRGPRLGSFEVFVELSFWDGLKGNQVAVLAPITSKLRSKKFPDLRLCIHLIRSTVVDNVKRLALKSIDSQQHGFTNELVHSVLQYTFTQEIGQEAAQPPSAQGVDEWAAALQIETWEAASVRELDMLPRLLMRSKSWRLLHNVVCSLHFLAAKLAKCGVNAVVGDLQAAQALIKQSTSASNQDSDHGVESKHLSTAAASLQRQLHSDVDTCLRFITKSASALLANPACIYARAQAYSLPALTTLKQRFVAVLQRLQMLAQNTDAEERESTGVELLQLSYGLTLMRWAERSRFLDAFSETDKRWMGYCQQDFQARITVRRQWIREMLVSEADGACALFEEQADDEVLGHLSGARRLMMLARSLTTKPFDCTMRLEYCSQEPISAQEGFERVQTVLRELLVDQGIVSVEADVVRESEQLTMASEDLFVYCVTVGLRMTPGAHAQGETLPNTRLESVESFVRSVLEDQGPELKAMLPNRTTLRYIGRERDAFLVLKMCLPTSMPCSDNDMHRYKELLRDDLVASSGYELETQCIEVLQLSRWGALVVVREALLPPRVSTVDIAKDWMQQLEATAAMTTPELLRGERLISLHVSWISCLFSKPPDRAWGQDGRALLYVLAESSDLEAERGILSGIVFPALAMECRFRDVHLDCLLFDGSAQSQQRGHREGASKSQSLVNRTRLLRNHLAERQDGSTVVKFGVVGRVQRIEAEIDAEVLRQDSENNWAWVSAPPFASMSTPLLHVYTALSLHGAGDRQAAASAAAQGIRRALSARKISFKANSAQLDDGGQEVLALVSSALKGLGTMGVDVHGHCESVSDGMALSLARAQAVVDWLTASGCTNVFRVHAHAHEHPDVGAQMMVRIIPAPGAHTMDLPGDGEEEDASVPRHGGEAVFAMVRRQEFGEHGDAGEFIKQVPAKLRAAFKPVHETQAAVQHVISRVYEKLGPEGVSEYRVGFNAYGPGDAAGCRRVGASKSVQQTGIEAFALRAYEHAVTSIMAAKAPVVCRRPYPWQLRELELQQCVQQRHQEVFFAEPSGQLQAAVEELVSIATSMDMTAPTLVLVDGVSGSGRSALLAQVSSSLAPPASKRYLVHYSKPQGTTLGQALPAIVSQLLLQLVGGKHLHVQRHKFKWTLSELFDVVQRCSAQSCHDASSTYRRVVLIFDGFDDAEQLDICEHLLARPRLFPLVTCIVATNSAHNDSGVAQHDADALVVLNRRRMIKSHLHSRVVAMPRLSEAEALQVAINMLTHTHQDPEAVMHICRQHLVRKREIWRPGYIRCLVQTIRCTSGALWTQALDAMPPTRALAFDRLLDALSEMYGALAVGALLCSLLSAPGSLDSELCMRHCKPNATLSHEHFASIMQLLQAYMVEEEMWRDRTLMLAQDCWPVIIAKFVIPQLDCLDQRTLDMLAHQSVASLCRTRAHAQLPPHAQHVGAGESNGAARAGLAVELPENLGVRLTTYWARLEEEAFVDDRRRFTVWQKQKSSSKLGHGRTANSSGFNSSMSLPSGFGGGGAGGRSASLEDSAQALSYLHDMRGEDRDEQIISKMMEEMMLTSQKAFGTYALDNVESSPGSSMSPGSRDLLQGVRPSSAMPYRDSPEVPRRPKSAGPVLRMRKPGVGYAGALLGGWEGEESNTLDNTVEETARPFLKLRSSPMRPQRLEENWIELDLQAFPIQRSPMFGKHRARRSSTSMSPAPNKPSSRALSRVQSVYTRDRGGTNSEKYSVQ